MAFSKLCGIAALLACWAAVQPATSATIPGYGTVSDAYYVHRLTGAEVMLFQEALSGEAPNYSAARSIYANGKSVPRPGAAGKFVAAKEAYYNKYPGSASYERTSKYYKGASPIHPLMITMFTDSKQCCGVRTESTKAVMRSWPFVYSMLKLDAAYNEGMKSNRNARTITSMVDQAASSWYGHESNSSRTPYGAAESFGVRMCVNASKTAGMSATNNEQFLVNASKFKAAALKGNKAEASKAFAALSSAHTATLLQLFLYNWKEAVTPPEGYVTRSPPCLVACGQSATAGIRTSKQAAALTYWQILAPHMAVKAPKETSAVMNRLKGSIASPAVQNAVTADIKKAAAANGISWTKQVDACPTP